MKKFYISKLSYVFIVLLLLFGIGSYIFGSIFAPEEITIFIFVSLLSLIIGLVSLPLLVFKRQWVEIHEDFFVLHHHYLFNKTVSWKWSEISHIIDDSWSFLSVCYLFKNGNFGERVTLVWYPSDLIEEITMRAYNAKTN